ncbi:hypothetical protein FBU30_001522 [Linnemannia zychae]|nr:hypothetical protein FBU30_001522 [Linnemannia zychae]
MHKAGLKSRKIATELDVNDRTVRAIIKRYQERGTLVPKPIPGRPRNPDKPSQAAVTIGSSSGNGIEGAQGDKSSTSIAAIAHSEAMGNRGSTTSKIAKKRGKRGPYKKREKIGVPAIGFPASIPPHATAENMSNSITGTEGGGVLLDRSDTSIITTVTSAAVCAGIAVDIERNRGARNVEIESHDMSDGK